MKYNLNHPTYLFIGEHKVLELKALDFLKYISCAKGIDNKSNDENSACNKCYACKAIDLKQYHNVRWIEPIKSYTLKDLEVVFSTAKYILPEGEHFFFILNHAEKLTSACANNLLKLLEEPPKGYHFILLSGSKESLLPTIISRCIIYNYTDNDINNDQLLNFFINPELERISEFNRYIENNNIDEHAVIKLLDGLEKYWLNKYYNYLKNDANDNLNNINENLNFIKKLRKCKPVQGSVKLALKNIMLFFLR